MSGRVAAVSGRPVFDVIRMRMGFGLGLLALLASTAVNLLTLAAELGGIAIVLELLLDAPYSMFVVTAAAALVLIVALLPFGRPAPLRRHRARLRQAFPWEAVVELTGDAVVVRT